MSGNSKLAVSTPASALVKTSCTESLYLEGRSQSHTPFLDARRGQALHFPNSEERQLGYGRADFHATSVLGRDELVHQVLAHDLVGEEARQVAGVAVPDVHQAVAVDAEDGRVGRVDEPRVPEVLAWRWVRVRGSGLSRECHISRSHECSQSPLDARRGVSACFSRGPGTRAPGRCAP